MCVWQKLKSQLILLFSLFLLLFMGLTALFGTIHGSHCTISTNFYLYLQYFQQKIFSFSKISGSQTDPKITKTKVSCNGADLKFYFAILVLGFVWIPFILLKIKNWKHCSKIIFKCVNSTVELIFNENFVEKRSLWVL